MSVRALILGVTFLLAPVHSAVAQSVTFAGVSVQLSDRSWDDLEGLVVAGEPVGDVGYVFEFDVEAVALSVDGGASSPGAWVTAYVPDGLQVVGAEIIERAPFGSLVSSPSAAGPALDGCGLMAPIFNAPWA
ncbi:MAG: hypothetical protein ACJAYU_002868, partial [Bradymonadia bacterium]